MILVCTKIFHCFQISPIRFMLEFTVANPVETMSAWSLCLLSLDLSLGIPWRCLKLCDHENWIHGMREKREKEVWETCQHFSPSQTCQLPSFLWGIFSSEQKREMLCLGEKIPKMLLHATKDRRSKTGHIFTVSELLFSVSCWRWKKFSGQNRQTYHVSRTIQLVETISQPVRNKTKQRTVLRAQ